MANRNPDTTATAWNAPDERGARVSKCGRYTIQRRRMVGHRRGRVTDYTLRYTHDGRSYVAEHDTLRDAREAAEDAAREAAGLTD